MPPNQRCLKSGAFSRTSLHFKGNQRSTVGFDHLRQLIFGVQRTFTLRGLHTTRFKQLAKKCVIVISMQITAPRPRSYSRLCLFCAINKLFAVDQQSVRDFDSRWISLMCRPGTSGRVMKTLLCTMYCSVTLCNTGPGCDERVFHSGRQHHTGPCQPQDHFCLDTWLLHNLELPHAHEKKGSGNFPDSFNITIQRSAKDGTAWRS